MLQRLSSSRPWLVLGRCDLHRLVEFILDDLTSGRLDILQCYSLFLRCALGLQPIAFGGYYVILNASREGLSHVLISQILLVDQVVRGRYMIVSIRFKASDRIVFLELEVVDQPSQ